MTETASETLYTFTPEPVPARTMPERFNPFTTPVGNLVPNSGEGIGFDVPAGVNLSTIRSQLDRAGRAQATPVTINWKISPKGAKTGPAHIIISASTKRTKKKPADAAPEPTPEPEAAPEPAPAPKGKGK